MSWTWVVRLCDYADCWGRAAQGHTSHHDTLAHACIYAMHKGVITASVMSDGLWQQPGMVDLAVDWC